MQLFKQLTVGNTKRMYKGILLTVILNIVNVFPFMLSIQVVSEVFKAFSTPEATLDMNKMWLIAGVLAAYMIVMYLAEIPAYRASFRGAYELSSKGRADLAEHIRKLPLGYIMSKDPGDLGNMMMGDFSLIENNVSHVMPQMVGAIVLPIMAFISLLFVDVKMAIAMFIALPIAMLVLGLTSNFQKKLTDKHMASKINAGNRLQEYIYGIKEMKAYNLVGSKFERLDKAFKELMKDSIKIEAGTGPFVMLSVALLRAGLSVMILVGTYMLIGGELDVLTFVMFLIIGARVFDPLSTSLYSFAELKYAARAGKRIMDLMAEEEMTGEKDAPAEHDIVFENVNFGYNKKEVLHDINVSMNSGELTALVGPSGSGKSTIMKLAARFYDPVSGKVKFGGENEAEVDPEKLMEKVSMVFQDVYLFEDTIAGNIGFGKEGATPEEIVEAAKKAQCHDFIMKLPKGYDTMVGEGGCTLSGGEKQRISIARAVLKNAPVVLLDEATASLDPENEIYVQKAINELIEGRTVIVIAHKLKTVMGADKIIVLDEGKVAEEGVHDELIKNNGLYTRLWNLQQESTGWQF